MSEENTNTTQTDELGNRLLALQQNLSNMEVRLKRSNRISLIVSLVVLAILSAYFVIGFIEIAPMMEPRNMVDFVMGELESNVPQVRQALEEQVEANAEVWAATLSEESLAAMPAVRGELEDYAMKQTGDIVDEVVKISKKQFEKIIKDNKPTLQNGFSDLANSEHLSEKSFRELETALEAELQQDMKEQASAVLDTLIALNSKLSNLQEGSSNLDKEGRLERRILMEARALQIQEAMGKKAKSTSKEWNPKLAEPDEKDTAAKDDNSEKKQDETKPQNPNSDKKEDDKAEKKKDSDAAKKKNSDAVEKKDSNDKKKKDTGAAKKSDTDSAKTKGEEPVNSDKEDKNKSTKKPATESESKSDKAE